MKRKYFLLVIIFIVSSSCSGQKDEDINQNETFVDCDISFDKFTGQAIYPESFGANISAQPYGYSMPFEMTKLNDYQNAMKEIGWPALRVNIGGWGRYLADPGSQLKDNQKLYWEAIDFLIENLKHFHSGQLMITCGSIPEWMDVHNKNDILLFANLVGKLAERFQSRGVKVDYWEIINEPSKEIFTEVCYIFNEVADRLREIDPMYKVGGPVTAWPYADLMKQFLQISGKHADFISYNMYGTSITKVESINMLMQTALLYKKQATQIRQLILDYLKKPLPIFIGEYNMTHGTEAPRLSYQGTIHGAVWSALVTCSSALEGVRMATIWDSFGQGTYGAISYEYPNIQNYTIRPVGLALAALKKRLPGQSVDCQIRNQEEQLFAIATKGERASTVLFVNYSTDKQLDIQLNIKGIALKGSYEYYELSSRNPKGYTEMRNIPNKMVILIPSMSMVILTYNN